MAFAADCIPIANSALTLVGTRLISAVTDNSKERVLMSTNWDTWRRAILRDGIWTFAKQPITVLTADPIYAPKVGFTTRFPVPTDFIRLVDFNQIKGNTDGTDAPYRVMGGFIYTNMSYGNLVYVSDITTVSLYDPLFCEAFSAYIAAASCKTLTGSGSDAAEFNKLYKQQLQKARFVGSVEDPSVQLDVDVWLQARVGVPTILRDPLFATDPSLDFPNQPGTGQ
jgi:hypothetical protein